MNLLINFAAFQVGWFSSVLGGAQQQPWIGPAAVLIIVALHVSRAERRAAELKLILLCGLIGAAFDSILVASGWVGYPSGMFSDVLAPYWIIAMWMLFATTLNLSMGWLKGRPLLAAAMGLIAGPMTYLAGHKLGGINFENQIVALMALGVGWAVMMPLLMRLATMYDGITPTPQPIVKQGSTA